MRSLCLAVLFALVAPTAFNAPSALAAEVARTGIEFSVEPASVKIEINGKMIGLAKDVSFVKLPPGRHRVRLERGEDEVETELQVTKGQVVQYTYEF